jgi:alpha/beta superfamily hydrolase
VPLLEQVEIPAPHGFLEGLLRQPDAPEGMEAGAGAPTMAALICHPHPVGGGTMHNKVVFRVAQALGDVGMPALRFNFRGVGRSTGQYDSGRGEAEDVRAVLDYLGARYPDVALCLAGFSFGAWVGLPVGCADPRVRLLVGVGVPVGLLTASALADCLQPKLIVQGERDQYGPLSALLPWYAALIEPKRLIVVPGADHFFTEHQTELRAVVAGYFRN